MQFGIFDQNALGADPLHQQYEKQLQLIELYEHCGFRAYPMSEHHSTPLDLAPSHAGLRLFVRYMNVPGRR